MGELSLAGFYPYLDYWMEYPPIFAWLLVGVYRLSFLLPAWPNDLLWFQALLSCLLAIVDLGNLVLIYRLASRLHDRALAFRAAWIYALLFFPLFATLGWLDTLPLFFLLLTIDLALDRRASSAGAIAAVGLMVKIIPIIAAPAALRALRSPGERVRFALSLLLMSTALAVPLLRANPTMFLASVRFMLGRASWETIWALIEGYHGTGRVPLLASRFDPELATWSPHPATLPWTAITGVFLLLGLILYTRRLSWSTPGVALPSTALTLHLFLLFSKGYSPQFLLYPLAFLVMLLPNPQGVAYALLLTANSLIEYPFAFGFFGDDGRLAWLVVVTRTILLGWIAIEYVAMLAEPPLERWTWLRQRLATGMIGVGALAVIAGGTLVIQRYVTPPRADDAAAVADYLNAFDQEDAVAVASSRAAFAQIRPRTTISSWVLIEADEGQWPTSASDRLAAARDGHARVWLIIDQAGPSLTESGELVRALDTWGSPATDRWFGRFHLLGYLSGQTSVGPSQRRSEVFGGSLSLEGADLSAEHLTPGDGLAVALYLQTLAPVGKDEKVFIHLLNAAGAIVAQRDRLLADRGLGSASWPAGLATRQGYDLQVPLDAACGPYTLEVGIYDPTTGQRLPITRGSHPGTTSVVLAELSICPRTGG